MSRLINTLQQRVRQLWEDRAPRRETESRRDSTLPTQKNRRYFT